MASNSEVLNPEHRARALGNPYAFAHPYDGRSSRWHGLVFSLLMGAAILVGAASTAW